MAANFYHVLLIASCAATVAADISRNVDDLRYYHVTSSDAKAEISYNDANSLMVSGIQSGRKTYFIVDGFLSTSTTPMSTNTSSAIATNKIETSNVILLDWGRLSGSGTDLGNPAATLVAYMQAMGNVEAVGQRLADFVQFVSTNKQIDPQDITLVCHSLGAPVCGQAGRTFQSKYNSKLSRIAGLDPAGPYASLSSPRLRSGDASFVDIYHSNAGTLGDTMDLGDVNIYINGGSSQPGCAVSDITETKGYCSHSYSWKFFDAQYINAAVACPCNLLLFTRCSCASCKFTCTNGITVGPSIDQSSSERYYVSYGEIE